MRQFTKKLILTIALTTFMGVAMTTMAQTVRKTESLDKSWRFTLGNPEGGENPNFDDSAWRKLDLPHDWSIEGEFNKENPTGRGGGYLPAGIGWYRKSLILPQSDAQKRIYIEFDGIMANSTVWINGHILGPPRPNGYVTQVFDITRYATFGVTKPNIIAVRADNSPQPASRWYTGAGIYRHTRLVTTNQIHIDTWGVFVTTPEVSAQKATVLVAAKVANESTAKQKYTIQTTLTSPTGKSFKSQPEIVNVAPGECAESALKIAVPTPDLWDIESPNLYTALTTVSIGGKVVDDHKTTFGIREFYFDAATGFYLNGKNIKIKGAAVHSDGGAVGAAVPASVWARRIELLKQVGCNAIRTAHNPVDPALLDLCDKMGIMVMNETFDTWTSPKNHASKGYNLYFKQWWEIDTRDVVMRDRNHPSVIIYSVGNEIRDNLDSPEGRERFVMQRDLVKSLDPSRPVTLGLFRPNSMNVYTNGFSELMDVVGQNYREEELVAAWQANPERKVLGTENRPDRQTWLFLRDNPFMSGQFVWTGFDYIGESDWPQVVWDTGIFGRNGEWKPMSWERQSWWSDKPMVQIVRKDDNGGVGKLTNDWTPIDFDTYDQAHVYVYSNCDEVELFLNGKSQGRQNTPENDEANFWNINFNPGIIKVVGYNDGKEVATQQYTTASQPEKVLVVAEKAKIKNSWDDVVYVKATIVDKDGVRFPNSHHKVKFEVSDNAEIVVVDNNDVTSHEKFKSNEKSVYKGEAIAIIRAKAPQGKITVKASAEGLSGSQVVIDIIL